MKRLGFKNSIFKQGLYVDGHEREDVVAYREMYQKKMKILESRHLPPPQCEDQLPSWHAGQPTMNKHLVIIYHDESTFNAYDAPCRRWVDPSGSAAIRPKGKGRGIMVSDYIEEYGGLLALTNEEAEEVRTYTSETVAIN